jgi:hypothetical protein
MPVRQQHRQGDFAQIWFGVMTSSSSATTLGTARLAHRAPCYTEDMTTQDMASHGTPHPDNGELRHTLSLHEVGAALGSAAGSLSASSSV